MNLKILVKNVEQWSIDKGLDQADSSKQFLKVAEENGEIAAALARGDKKALKDGIGDELVTLIILGQQNGLTLEECLNTAYQEIAGRKGKMIDGVFIKEEDIKEVF
ncbi:MazG-like family protein [Oceanobacillus iheyensis]|uniref:MazG-like family protein n=1 Tax=Oceanobacillus iheyensis TaxID=182710 RepID=UPI00363BBE07